MDIRLSRIRDADDDDDESMCCPFRGVFLPRLVLRLSALVTSPRASRRASDDGHERRDTRLSMVFDRNRDRDVISLDGTSEELTTLRRSVRSRSEAASFIVTKVDPDDDELPFLSYRLV
ncbi:unnamed protein product [Soboliphyme baturini]|uniref:Uncharacterized protein n=1 Tax=Soboliphyme baturini TaxID=241478 RepID=A0A183J211_9BILA|nr:unnamed protein product [Soboliphyme baturini]